MGFRGEAEEGVLVDEIPQNLIVLVQL